MKNPAKRGYAFCGVRCRFLFRLFLCCHYTTWLLFLQAVFARRSIFDGCFCFSLINFANSIAEPRETQGRDGNMCELFTVYRGIKRHCKKV
jgi:hypothetical protein